MAKIAQMLTVLGVVSLAGVARTDGTVLLKNAKNPVASLSKEELRAVMVGQKKAWGNGAAVQVVLSAPGSPGSQWLAAQVGVSEKDLLAKIKQEVFRGEMKKPIIADSDDIGAEAVKKDPGAIYPGPETLVTGALAALPVGG